MKIIPQNKKYFRFAFSRQEKETAAAKEFVAEMKEKIPHGKRYWIREARAWAIHEDCLDEFCDCLVRYVVRTVITKQGEIF